MFDGGGLSQPRGGCWHYLLSLKNLDHKCTGPRRFTEAAVGLAISCILRRSDLQLGVRPGGWDACSPLDQDPQPCQRGAGWGRSPRRKYPPPKAFCSVGPFSQRPPGGSLGTPAPARRHPLSLVGTGPLRLPVPGHLPRRGWHSLSCGPSRALVGSSEALVRGLQGQTQSPRPGLRSQFGNGPAVGARAGALWPGPSACIPGIGHEDPLALPNSGGRVCVV